MFSLYRNWEVLGPNRSFVRMRRGMRSLPDGVKVAGYTERGAKADSSPGFRNILSTSAACTSSA